MEKADPDAVALSEDNFDLGTADEELGSPLLTIETAWLVGLVIGLAAILLVGRRRRKRAIRNSVESQTL